MAKTGWISIRNLPELAHSSTYYDHLLSFFAKNSICPKCKGKGFDLSGTDYVDISAVKIADIKQIKKLRALENVNISDIIRDILEREILDKTPCVLCNGQRFVSRKVAKKYRLSRKKKSG